MRLLLRYLLILGFLLVVSSVLIPLRYDIAYPKKVGPKFNNFIRMQYQDNLVKDNPDLVLIGDSVLAMGVDSGQLARQTGVSADAIGIPGSASAVWYLLMKHIIITAPHKPHYVIVVFRDTILTVPDYRVNGKYFALLDELANTDDTVVTQKAFIQQMSPIEKWADRFVPVYGSRLRVRETVDYYIRYTLSGLAGCDQKCNDDANYSVFLDLNLDSNMLVEAIATAEAYLYTPEQMAFSTQLDKSFLPDIVRMAKENNIQLILMRTKHLDMPTEATEPAALKGYIGALNQYAVQNDLIMLDFSHEERLTNDLFVDTHHLTPAGQSVFTEMLAEALKPILKK